MPDQRRTHQPVRLYLAIGLIALGLYLSHRLTAPLRHQHDATAVIATPVDFNEPDFDPNTVTLTATAPQITDTTLKMRFEIHNDSDQDIWICDDISVLLKDYDVEAYLAEDRQTLLIRRRLDIDPCNSVQAPPHGRYVRLPPGQTRTESLFLSLPLESRFFWGFPTSRYEASATRLALELGFYPGDMPRMIRSTLSEPEMPGANQPALRWSEDHYAYVPETPPLRAWFKSLLRFNWENWPPRPFVRHRDEEILIPWTGSRRMGERVLRIELDGLHIPYEEKHEHAAASPPDLSQCTRIEIHYQPSALDYFFPYPQERALMSPEEIESLQSLRSIVVDDREQIEAFAREVAEEDMAGGILSERSSAHITGFRDAQRLTSFTVYDDRAIVTDDEQCIRCIAGLPSMNTLTAPIHPFELRLECANRLMNLSSLLQFLYQDRRTYRASRWSSVIATDRRADDIPATARRRYLRCPAQDQGKCHYAMNPHCKPDSPGDMVLLFEAKAGWNQHGGPELFTFDNHDPKGGCVLLNDSTVKFVRTQEELHALRWK
jgi:hypothetical protein